jgi:hypothetical protein
MLLSGMRLPKELERFSEERSGRRKSYTQTIKNPLFDNGERGL